ncbi:DoxX family protein [Georgenia alba]|uniref:DoxX family protein n=1 Tax=Georgenia alba TaxID=2233858 RepID=A0ABW2Q7K2_9MICO
MTLGNRVPAPARDTALLIARLLLGAILVRHGWQKAFENGYGGTAAGFEQMGVPLPQAAAAFAIVAELGGGALLLLGLLTPVAAALVVVMMTGAFLVAHRRLEPLVTEGGWELVAALGCGALLLGVLGAGRLSLDHAVFGGRRDHTAQTAEQSPR